MSRNTLAAPRATTQARLADLRDWFSQVLLGAPSDRPELALAIFDTEHPNCLAPVPLDENAVEVAARCAADLRTVGVSLAAFVPEDSHKWRQRHKAKLAGGFFFDADLVCEEHEKGFKDRRDLDRFLAELASLNFAPSLVVETGGGVHLSYLFPEWLDLSDTVEARKLNILGEKVRDTLAQAAKKHGGTLDNWQGFQQPTRPAGAVRRKEGRENLVRWKSRPAKKVRRYDPAEIEELLELELRAYLDAALATPKRRTSTSSYSANNVSIPWGELAEAVLEALGAASEGKLLEGEPASWRFSSCPVCQGGRKGSKQTARLTAGGYLSCFRASCAAGTSEEGGGGLRLDDWLPLAGVTGSDKAKLLKLRRRASEEARAKKQESAEGRALFSDHAPKLSRSTEESGEEWKARTAKAVAQVLADASVEARSSGAALVTPTGSGKSTATRRLVANDPELKLLVSLRDHALAKEWEAELVAEGVSTQRLEGIATACEYREEYLKQGQPFEWWKRERCPGCSFRDTCKALEKTRGEARVVIVTHERLLGVRGEDLEKLTAGRSVVVDEFPEPLAHDALKKADADSTRSGLAKSFEANFARDLELALDLLDELGRKARADFLAQGGELGEFGARIESDKLRAHLETLLDAPRRVALEGVALYRSRDVLRRTEGKVFLRAPLKATSKAAYIGERDAVNLATPRKLERLLAWFKRASDAPTTAELFLAPEGDEWTLELRTTRRLPAGTLLLDATANLRKGELAQLFGGTGPKLFEQNLERAPEHRRVWLQTGEAKRQNLGAGGALALYGWARLAEFFGDALEQEQAREVLAKVQGRKVRVGLLTFKSTADDLRAALKKDEAGTLRRLGLDPDRFELGDRVGHYGLDDTGTNRFKDCDLFALFGDPVPNLGAVEADARALGLDPVELLGSRVAATTAQAVGRSRDLFPRADGSAVVTLAGLDSPPAGWSRGDFLAVLRKTGRADDLIRRATAFLRATFEATGELLLDAKALAELWEVDSSECVRDEREGDGQKVPHMHSELSTLRGSPPSPATFKRAAKDLEEELVAEGEAVLELVPRAEGGHPRRILRRRAAVLVPMPPPVEVVEPIFELVEPLTWGTAPEATWEDLDEVTWEDLERLEGPRVLSLPRALDDRRRALDALRLEASRRRA